MSINPEKTVIGFKMEYTTTELVLVTNDSEEDDDLNDESNDESNDQPIEDGVNNGDPS